MPLEPSANLPLSRYDYAVQRLHELVTTLPSTIVFDVGAGDGRLSGIESFGFDWHGFDLKSRGNVNRWDLSDPCPIQTREGCWCRSVARRYRTLRQPGIGASEHCGGHGAGGRLILTTPNARWSASRPHFLFRGTLSGFTDWISTKITTRSRYGLMSSRNCSVMPAFKSKNM